jgi:hypothetical protein
VRQSYQNNVFGQHWLDIDPNQSMNAMHLGSWSDDFELKLLVKVKLNDNGYKLDYLLERDLENFIKLKQKQ